MRFVRVSHLYYVSVAAALISLTLLDTITGRLIFAIIAAGHLINLLRWVRMAGAENALAERAVRLRLRARVLEQFENEES